jgi:hypothetical protein
VGPDLGQAEVQAGHRGLGAKRDDDVEDVGGEDGLFVLCQNFFHRSSERLSCNARDLKLYLLHRVQIVLADGVGLLAQSLSDFKKHDRGLDAGQDLVNDFHT